MSMVRSRVLVFEEGAKARNANTFRANMIILYKTYKLMDVVGWEDRGVVHPPEINF